MKKIMFASVVAFAASMAMAAANDLLVTFSTPGTDKYADGETVLNGERYALVWSKTASSLETLPITADGKLDAEYGAIVLTAPYAKDGKCPTIMFEVDAADAATKYVGGAWGVYLLDTRVFDASGKATVSPTLSVINAASFVSGSKVTISEGALASVSPSVGQGGILAAGETALPKDTPQPKVKDISVRDGSVFVTVENTVPYIAYNLSASDTPGAEMTEIKDPRSGVEGGEIIFVRPAKEGSEFFKVGRKK